MTALSEGGRGCLLSSLPAGGAPPAGSREWSRRGPLGRTRTRTRPHIPQPGHAGDRPAARPPRGAGTRRRVGPGSLRPAPGFFRPARHSANSPRPAVSALSLRPSPSARALSLSLRPSLSARARSLCVPHPARALSLRPSLSVRALSAALTQRSRSLSVSLTQCALSLCILHSARRSLCVRHSELSLGALEPLETERGRARSRVSACVRARARACVPLAPAAAGGRERARARTRAPAARQRDPAAGPAAPPQPVGLIVSANPF